MCPHTEDLFRLLDKLEMVNLSEAAQIFDFLCSVIWLKIDSTDSFQNQMHMIIRKQIHSTKMSVRYRGIVAVAAAVKHIANSTQSDQSVDMNASYTSVSDLPLGAAKLAGELLQMASESVASYPLSQGLYYDQLAQVIVKCQNLNRPFMSWLTENITAEFQNNYIVTTNPDPINDVNFEVLYNLNDKESIDENIIINIGKYLKYI